MHRPSAPVPQPAIITDVHVKWLSDNQKTSEFYARQQMMAAQVIV